MKQGLIIDENGDKAWYLNDQRHRIDCPACEWSDGTKAWFLNGKFHREDGPAMEDNDGYKAWYLNGKLVYSKDKNNIHKYPNLTESFKLSIIKYRLTI